MGGSVSVESPEPVNHPQFRYLNKQKTILIKPQYERVRRSLTLRANLQATLKGNSNLHNTVKLPQDEDLNEWIAMNTFLFFQVATDLHSMCSKFCTMSSCPHMSAGGLEYQWTNSTSKEPEDLPAPEYIEHMFDWVHETISDPEIFPQDDETKFPVNFMDTAQTLYKRLFRLYAHIFHAHFDDFRDLGSEAHLNSSFKHFAYFVLEFQLVSPEELRPLDGLINLLLQQQQK